MAFRSPGKRHRPESETTQYWTENGAVSLGAVVGDVCISVFLAISGGKRIISGLPFYVKPCGPVESLPRPILHSHIARRGGVCRELFKCKANVKPPDHWLGVFGGPAALWCWCGVFHAKSLPNFLGGLQDIFKKPCIYWLNLLLTWVDSFGKLIK